MLGNLLANDALLWGSIALGFIAMFTISRVVRRRRRALTTGRALRAQNQAMHTFLDTVRAGQSAAEQGVWHYNFATGAQQMSEGLKRLIAGDEAGGLDDAQIEEMLGVHGVDLVKIARKHADESEPFALELILTSPKDEARTIELKAYNFRNSEGAAQRLVAVMREKSLLSSKDSDS